MRVLLVTPMTEFKHIDVPLGQLYLATYIKNNVKNCNVKIFDLPFDKFSKELKINKPDVVGIYSTIVQLNIVKKYIKAIRRILPFAKIVLGGPTTVSSARLLLNLKPDAITISEGEIPFSKYLKNYNNSKKLLKIPNLIIKIDNDYIETERKLEFIDLEKTPLPDFNFINVEKYIEKWYYFDYFNDVRGVSLMTSRGCPFRCTFCQPIVNQMFGKKLRNHKVEDIVDKLEELYVEKDLKFFFFHDDTFTINKKRIVEFCTEILKRNLHIKWGCNTRVNSIDFETCKLMKKAGCIEIRLGIETYNQKTLDLIRKDINSKDIDKTINIIKRNKINSLAFIMIGFPNEEIIDIFRTFFKTTKSNLDFMRISILTSLPGTVIAEQFPIESAKCENFNYIKHSFNNPSKINNGILEILKIIGYFIFYLNPKRILKTISIVNSPKKLFSKLERI